MKKIALILISLFLFTACSSSYNVKVDLKPEEVAQLETEVKTYQEKIKAYDTSDGTIAYDSIIELARAYEKLGKLGKAIEVYEEVIDSGKKTMAIIHNLGRLYEKVGKYDLAVKQYQRLMDEYMDRSYLYDITWAYINAKDVRNAEKYFNAWQLEYKKTDEQTQEAIKELRNTVK